MKKEFVRLCLLQDITFEGETAEQRASWVANVTDSVGSEGYGLAGTDDYDTALFSADEVDFAEVNLYCFMGSEYEQERFYTKEAFIVQEKATGDYYALLTEELFEV